MVEHGSRDSIHGELQHDNAFWRFSLAVYEPGVVANECLALQAALGLDVNVLLYCAWLGAHAVALSRNDIEAACRVVASWHDGIVRPLRHVRQQMKTYGIAFESLRARVKALELEAEQVEQALLFGHAQGIIGSREGADRNDAIARNVNEYIAMKSGQASPQREQAAPSLIRAAQCLAL